MAIREENLKKINAELEKLSDYELDNIVGGANGYVYCVRAELHTQGINGYYLVFSDKPMSMEDVRDYVFSAPDFMRPFVDYKDKDKFFDIAKAKGYEVIDTAKMKN